MWINHFGLLPGDSSVLVSFKAVSSGLGGGPPGLVIQSTTAGDTTPNGGDKVVYLGLEVPPGYLIKGVRACYELSDKGSFISQVRLLQLNNPPNSVNLMLDESLDQTTLGPICADCTTTTTIDPVRGAVVLLLRVSFGNASDKITVLALGLDLIAS